MNARPTAKQRGFTLIEVMLVMAIAAVAAMAVMVFLPESASQQQFGERFRALLEYAADRAVYAHQPVGIALSEGHYQLLQLAPSDAQAKRPGWLPLKRGRYADNGQFPDELVVALNGRPLPPVLSLVPQVYFLPDGETSVFTLTFTQPDTGEGFTLTSSGGAPFELQKIGRPE
ncbi:type II secretion system minor pseudopilin GspH [Pantoea sp.]|uniref:type II secretion system minor pseudopilin GspH n=1 Tax=Pantoea sp. TaxID=69393 RepID=UPI00289A213C|nr:type II secretion system minor pseudopilin GspH [Pantoea sp.]